MTNEAELQAFKARTKSAPNGCIEWVGPRHPDGYGRFTFKRQQRLAHRAAWQLFKGDLPADACVLHRCDHPPCVNPDHLFLGNRGDNARDMASKGRQWVQKNPAGRPVCPDELKPRGSRHGSAKLTEADILVIRNSYSQGALQTELAKRFGCADTLISQIVCGRIWRHVGGPLKVIKIKESKK